MRVCHDEESHSAALFDSMGAPAMSLGIGTGATVGCPSSAAHSGSSTAVHVVNIVDRVRHEYARLDVAIPTIREPVEIISARYVVHSERDSRS